MSRIISSYHSIMESLKTGEGVLYLSKSNKRIAELERTAQKKGIPVKKISASEMQGMSGSEEHKGALFLEKSDSSKALAHSQGSSSNRPRDLKSFLRNKEGRKDMLVLLLDGVTDPHNLGAILRSADQFAVDLVLLPAKRSAGINSTVAKVSVGAHAWVPVLQINNPSRALEELKENGFWIYGAHMGGQTAFQTDLRGRTCLVLGSEGKGMSRLVQEKCDTQLSIPMKGHVDSLNVSVAAGILMYEVIRQRG